ncbi:MAG: hypothetical protein QM774_08235 [Gordonia sp. (in: high G+C Gram-positive bacteria)]
MGEDPVRRLRECVRRECRGELDEVGLDLLPHVGVESSGQALHRLGDHGEVAVPDRPGGQSRRGGGQSRVEALAGHRGHGRQVIGVRLAPLGFARTQPLTHREIGSGAQVPGYAIHTPVGDLRELCGRNIIQAAPHPLGGFDDPIHLLHRARGHPAGGGGHLLGYRIHELSELHRRVGQGRAGDVDDGRRHPDHPL